MKNQTGYFPRKPGGETPYPLSQSAIGSWLRNNVTSCAGQSFNFVTRPPLTWIKFSFRKSASVAVKIIALLHAMILRNNFDGRNHCDNHCAFAVMRYSDLVQRFSIRAHEVTLFSGNSFNSIWRINNSNSNFLLLRTQWFSETQWFCPSKSLPSVIS